MFVRFTPKIPHTKVIPLVALKGEVAPDNDTVLLRPGTNEITEKEWATIQPHIKNLIGKEIVVFSVPVKEGGKEKQAKTLKDVPLATARKIIDGCQDPNTLKKWFNQELPDDLLLVLSKRMRKLKVEPEDIEDDAASTALKDTDITDEGDPEKTDEKTPAKPPKPKKGSKAGTPEPTGDDINDDIDDDITDDDDIPDFDGSKGAGGDI